MRAVGRAPQAERNLSFIWACVEPLRAAGKCRVTLPRPLKRKEEEDEQKARAAEVAGSSVGGG